MRKIAIVGAGQAGLQLAFGLLCHGYQVTVYSDRSAREVLGGRVTGTSFLFHRAVGYERELGLDFWSGEVEPGEGIHLDFCPTPGNLLLAAQGRFKAPGMAIDPRLKFSRWMDELEIRGGRLIVRELSLADLDAVAAQHDLVVIATGTGRLSSLFQRDAEKSRHFLPQRRLALLTLKGVERWGHVPFHPAKFTLIGSEGEIFWIPFHDKSAGSCHSVVFEARPGLRMDRFRSARTGEEALAIARRVVAELAPWEAHRLDRAELTDPRAWSVGAITPVVCKPVGRLPSGHLVFGLGDAVVLNDPIAAQGANHAAKAAHFLCEQIVERADGPFDAEWMTAGFEDFWQREACYMTGLSDLFLEPLAAPAREVLLAASRSPGVAEDFFEGFNEPRSLWPWIEDLTLARRKISERTGHAWFQTSGAARFSVGQGHPQTSQIRFHENPMAPLDPEDWPGAER